MGPNYRFFLLCRILWFLFIFAFVDAVDIKTFLSSRYSLTEEKGMLPSSNEVPSISEVNEARLLLARQEAIRHRKNSIQSKQVTRKLEKDDKEKGKVKRAMGKAKGRMKNPKGMMKRGKVPKKKSSSPNITPVVAPATSPIVLSPAAAPVQTALAVDFSISFSAPDATSEPTQDEYDEMFQRITTYFKDFLTGYYATDSDAEFLDLVSSLDSTLYGDEAGIQDPRFNIYMDFDFSNFSFTDESVVPTSAEMFQIMSEAITADFILEVVRTLTGSAFESTNEVFFALN